MVHLLLSEPTWTDNGDSSAGNQRVSQLKKLESIIRPLITSEARSEARLWLCNTISSLTSITPQGQCQIFVNLLTARSRKPALAVQLLQMIFEKRPHKVGPIIAKKTYTLEKFFKGNPRRIMKWFGNFAGVGETEHRKGARAISQYAFVNRDVCWDELEWMGKHGQSPAVVATKPHYFLDLDVQRTVENFLENVPDFWSSDELAESIKDGEILAIDTKFFIDCFLDLIYMEDSKEVWDVINQFLMEESFTFLCQRLLIILEEQDLLNFLDLLCKYLTPRQESKYVGHSSYWLEILLFMQIRCESIDELLLLNAVINQGRQILRLLRDDELGEQKQEIAELVREINTTSMIADAALVKECVNMGKSDSLKWIALQSWVLYYILSEECDDTTESWEALFVRNGISFRKSTGYDLLHIDEISEAGESELDDRGSNRAKRKKKRKSRKKKRSHRGRRDGNDESELLGLDGLQPTTGGSWFLSTDGYSSSWNSMDLPEHLAKHCFSTWLKWVSSKWNLLP